MSHPLRLWSLSFLVCLLTACHQEVKEVPLNTRPILVTDKFYDVKALSAEKAVVVGYAGKILLTTDGGKQWHTKASGTDVALYNVKFADAQNGWICGQDGLILHTTDGGETWQKQESGIKLPIFAMAFVDQNRGWAVAQQATYLHTTNGGASWEQGRIEASVEGVSEESTLALVDPTLYDIYFLDEKTGWMVGEFGKIYHSTDGGATWKEQQNALLGQAGIDDALNLPTWFGVRFVNASEGTVVGLEGKIAETTNGGQTWTYTAEDLAVTSTDPLYALRLTGNGGGWIVGASARVLQLRQGEWKPTPLGIQAVAWLRAINFFDDNHGWIVGGYGTILRTTDAGKTWLRSVG
jgi:photosystem II stability/assembly factor-like uncharacterized protein